MSSFWIRLGIIAALVLGLFLVVPPFRLVTLGNPTSVAGAETTFAPGPFAEEFWTARLLPATTSATPLDAILTALRRDPPSAAREYGKRVGLGSAVYFFAQGSGTVVELRASEIILAVNGGEGLLISLRTGPVFGNTIRDGCGLLDLNDFPGLTAFNAISTELNRLVEEWVQPPLKGQATLGARLEFAGCAPAPESLPGDGPVLKIIPLRTNFLP
jgi:predicted lipoprotein